MSNKPLGLLHITLPLLLLLLSWQAITGPWFRITRLECFLDGQVCDSGLLQSLADLQHSSLLLVNTHSLQSQLRQTYPEIHRVKVKVIFPDRIRLDLFTDKEIINLSLIRLSLPPTPTPTRTTVPPPAGGSALLATPSAHFITSLLPALRLPVFDQLSLLGNGQLFKPVLLTTSPYSAKLLLANSLPSSEYLQNFYQLYHQLSRSGLDTSQLWLFEDLAALSLSPNLIVFSLNADPSTSISSLQQIRSQSTIDLDQVVIDLRFTNPVISRY